MQRALLSLMLLCAWAEARARRLLRGRGGA